MDDDWENASFDDLDFDDDEPELEEAPPAPAAAETPTPEKLKGRAAKEAENAERLAKQAAIDAKMLAARQREQAIKAKLGPGASKRDIQNKITEAHNRSDVADLFGDMAIGSDDADSDEGNNDDAPGFMGGVGSGGGGGGGGGYGGEGIDISEFSSPIEASLAVLKIIGVPEHEKFGESLAEKLVDQENAENAMGILKAMLRKLSLMFGSEEYQELAKLCNVQRTEVMRREKLERGQKKKKKSSKPKLNTNARALDLASMGKGGDYGGYDQYW